MFRYVHTNIVAKDAERLIRFYKTVFRCKSIGETRDLSGDWLDRLTGLPEAHITGEHLCLPGYGADHPTLEIFSYDAVEPGESRINRCGLAHLAFEVDDVEETLKLFLAEGGSQIGELVTAEYEGGKKAVFVYARDPEGNIIELQSWRPGKGEGEPFFEIAPYERAYRDNMLFCLLSAKDALGGRPTINEDLLDVENTYIARGDCFWLAVQGSRVVGMLGVRAASPSDLWLKRLYVKPAMKRRGVGSALLAAAERYAAGKGYARIHTRFSDDYEEASRFYPAKGFVESERSDGLRHMVRPIPAPGSSRG